MKRSGTGAVGAEIHAGAAQPAGGGERGLGSAAAQEPSRLGDVGNPDVPQKDRLVIVASR